MKTYEKTIRNNTLSQLIRRRMRLERERDKKPVSEMLWVNFDKDYDPLYNKIDMVNIVLHERLESLIQDALMKKNEDSEVILELTSSV